ncbi:MAG: hypothetical protein J6Y02_24170 [Pseudobutyrivibrio sp.]|nr:hypothetical protein [Pseudobutyrivibrio sp.]
MINANRAGTITSFTHASAATKINWIYAGDGYIEGVTPETSGAWDIYTGSIQTPSKLADYKAIFCYCSSVLHNQAAIPSGQCVLSIEQLVGIGVRIQVASDPIFHINSVDLDANTINVTIRRATPESYNKYLTYYQILGVS